MTHSTHFFISYVLFYNVCCYYDIYIRYYCNSQQFWVPCLSAITPTAITGIVAAAGMFTQTLITLWSDVAIFFIAVANLTNINKILCLHDSITSSRWFVLSFILVCDLTTSHNVVHKSSSLTVLTVMTASALIIHCTNCYMDSLNTTDDRTHGA